MDTHPTWPTRPGRALDIALGLLLLGAAAPVLAVLALLVRTTSRGPAIFRQRRMGAGGGEFTLYKFRTMRCDCRGPELTGDCDARVTRVGHLLRRSHLDEFPQFFNVVRGDMTLVGPRPETPGLARRYPPEYQWVFDHRPGLTGPVQLLSHEFEVLVEQQADPEAYYLDVLVPYRTALDAEFLADPTTFKALRFVLRTIRCVLFSSTDREGTDPDAHLHLHGRPLEDGLLDHGPLERGRR